MREVLMHGSVAVDLRHTAPSRIHQQRRYSRGLKACGTATLCANTLRRCVSFGGEEC